MCNIWTNWSANHWQAYWGCTFSIFPFLKLTIFYSLHEILKLSQGLDQHICTLHSLVPRPVRAIRVTRGGLEPSAIARGLANFPNKLDRWRHIRNRRGRLGTRLYTAISSFHNTERKTANTVWGTKLWTRVFSHCFFNSLFGQYAAQDFQWLSVKLNFTSVLDQRCQAGNYTKWSPSDEVRTQLLELMDN